MKNTMRISSETIVQVIKNLKNGDTVTCPLCQKGIFKEIEKEHCFICDFCKEMLNID